MRARLARELARLFERLWPSPSPRRRSRAWLCSVMIYHATRRPFWHARPAPKSSGHDGCARPRSAALLCARRRLVEDDARSELSPGLERSRCSALAHRRSAAAKLLFEATIFAHLRDRRFTPLRGPRDCWSRPLAGGQVSCASRRGALGGIVVPLLLLSADAATPPALAAAFALWSLSSLLGGELAGRYLFFTAVVAAEDAGRAGRMT